MAENLLLSLHSMIIIFIFAIAYLELISYSDIYGSRFTFINSCTLVPKCSCCCFMR